MSAPLSIRDARAGDEEAIVSALREFAEFERLTHIFRLTPEIVSRDFIGGRRRVRCDIAEWDGAFAALMIWFLAYATFSAVPVIFLEDIFVKPEFRRRGIGSALLRHLARRARAEGAAHIDWAVLDWNSDAIDFYTRLGAPVSKEWRICRLTGEALDQLAE